MPTETGRLQFPFVATRPGISRRAFLRNAGIALALPLLDSMRPVFGDVLARSATAAHPPRRLLAICNNLGLLPEFFFPQVSGRDFALSPYLQLLRDYRNELTVFSGVSHPDVDGGHPTDNCFLTAAPHPGSGGFRNSISLDQYIAERLGHLTRFPSLNLGVNVQQGMRSLSWTGSGVLIPCDESASDVFRRLFVQGTPEDTERQMRRISLGQSILDAVSIQARSLQKKVGARDRERLDQYFSSVRDLEQRMTMASEWERHPRPAVKATMPQDPESPREYMDKVRLMYDLARLAFETDSTRTITLLLDSVNSPAIELDGAAVSDGYHNLSHHGKSEAKIAQLRAIDEAHMRLLGGLLGGLKQTPEHGATLLDRTMVLYGSNLGNAHTHMNTNLPVLLAGGGFHHGQHLVFDTARNYPLPNLFVSMLQRMDIEADRFASSTGTFRGLEMS